MCDIIEQIPAFLREFLEREYGKEAARVLAGYGVQRPVTFRANSLRGSAEALFAELSEAGLDVRRAEFYGDAFLLCNGREDALRATAAYAEGRLYLQSFSSMLPPLLLAPRAGERILDMTAAPGGKTAQLCALSQDRALVTACEKDAIRFGRMQYNLARLGAERVTALHADALSLSDFFRFDKILLDAPCSGSGTLSPGKRSPLSQKLLENCMKAQRALLKKGLGLLKSGGRLVYSTCSVLKEENEEAVLSVLKGGVRLVPVPAEFSAPLPRLPGMEGTLTVCPDGLFEGFFLAVLEKE